MKAAVIVYPGSNCDRDIAVALEKVTGRKPLMVWHGESDFEAVDVIALPGGFSYGDYLRSGAIAARSPVTAEVVKRAAAGVPTIGVCNGFQVLTETGLLPGALMRNANLKFVCKDVHLKVENAATIFSNAFDKDQVIRLPVAHHDGNYFADPATIEALEAEGRVVFRYVNADGSSGNGANPNGSRNDIAGIVNQQGNVLGMMPHPERLIEQALGGADGRALFESLAQAIDKTAG
ncbi:MAG: phosphoribosylformylglycinamidine synthase subunit PurQ [Proteobacteria bacterium]|nr:phosphoribosylformylglycinamidine synthase subunit PurQ [Pseudomonadota bacterium]